ncbi:hypothetical protein MRX96_035478 [Rhipicephalus microplus]
MSFDFQKTFTFWSVVIGSTITWTMSMCTNQTMIQRYCSLKSINKARAALYINMLGVGGTLTLSAFCGLVLFALYHQCDPVKASVIKKYDEMMPYFVMDNLGHLPGMTGLFVTAVYSGSLSTMSSGYNAIGRHHMGGFLKAQAEAVSERCHVGNKSDRGHLRSSDDCHRISRRHPAFHPFGNFRHNGLLCGRLRRNILSRPPVPMTVIVSMLTGMALSFWVAIGGMVYPRKPVVARTTVEACAFNYTLRVPPHRTYYTGGVYDLYHISYMWIPVISFLSTIFVAVAITLIRGTKNAADVDPRLLAPGIRQYYIRTRAKDEEQNTKEQQVIKEQKQVIKEPLKIEVIQVRGHRCNAGKIRTPRMTPPEKPEKLREIVSYTNGHVNYAMTNDDGTEHTAM